MRRNWPSISRPSELLIAASLFVASLSIYLLSPVHQITDSSYSMLLSECLIHHRSFELGRHYALPQYQPDWLLYYFRNGNIYQLELVNGHLYYHLPPGAPILSVPFVAVMNMLDVSAANSDGTYNAWGEERIEMILAALLMASLVTVFFFTARLVLPTGWSVVVALGGGLGTQIWSTASRAVWSDTWGTLLLAIVLLMLLAQEAGKHRLKPVLLATLLSVLYIVRPTYSVHILAVTVYLFFFHRPLFVHYATTGMAWFAAFMLYSWSLYRRLLPSYFNPGRLHFAVAIEGLAGNLFGPGRGLLIYVPVLIFVAYLLVRYRPDIATPRLVLMAVCVIVCHLVVTSATMQWWGGFSFGPRFTTSLVPWFTLLAVIGIQAMRRHHSIVAGAARLAHGIELASGAALLLLSITINGLGAIDHATWFWNTRPLNIDQHFERLWDWRQPQFLAGFIHPPLPKEIPFLRFQRLAFAKSETIPYLWYGWSPAEPDFRWSEGSEAAVVFALNKPTDILLTIKLLPFLMPDRHPQQRVSIVLNGRPIQTLTLTKAELSEEILLLPESSLQTNNILKFELPDAVSPASFGLSTDERSLGISVYWMQFQPKESTR